MSQDGVGVSGRKDPAAYPRKERGALNRSQFEEETPDFQKEKNTGNQEGTRIRPLQLPGCPFRRFNTAGAQQCLLVFWRETPEAPCPPLGGRLAGEGGGCHPGVARLTGTREAPLRLTSFGKNGCQDPGGESTGAPETTVPAQATDGVAARDRSAWCHRPAGNARRSETPGRRRAGQQREGQRRSKANRVAVLRNRWSRGEENHSAKMPQRPATRRRREEQHVGEELQRSGSIRAVVKKKKKGKGRKRVSVWEEVRLQPSDEPRWTPQAPRSPGGGSGPCLGGLCALPGPTHAPPDR